MKYDFYQRVYATHALVYVSAMPFFVYFLVNRYVDNRSVVFIVILAVLATYIAFLINSKLATFLRAKFPALRASAVRFMVMGLFALTLASVNDNPRNDVMEWYWTGIFFLGVTFFMSAYFLGIFWPSKVSDSRD